MPRPVINPTELEATTADNDSPPETDSTTPPPGRFDSSERSQWATLIAEGSVAFPEGLSSDEQERLVEEVRHRRRARLVQFIARVIAQDILRMRGP
jgi:hypothetical protein